MGALTGERACGGATPFSGHRLLLLAVALEQRRRGKREKGEGKGLAGTTPVEPPANRRRWPPRPSLGSPAATPPVAKREER
jgi:hypothetical protein